MFIQGDRVDSIASKRSAAERFINLRQQKKVKEFLVKLIKVDFRILEFMFIINQLE